MKKKISINFLLTLLILILGFASLLISNHTRYKEITKDFARLTIADIKSEDQEDRQVFIGSSQCKDCIDNINNIYLKLKKEGYPVYYINFDSLKDEEKDSLIREFGIEEIPSILTITGGESQLIGPKELVLQ